MFLLCSLLLHCPPTNPRNTNWLIPGINASRNPTKHDSWGLIPSRSCKWIKLYPNSAFILYLKTLFQIGLQYHQSLFYLSVTRDFVNRKCLTTIFVSWSPIKTLGNYLAQSGWHKNLLTGWVTSIITLWLFTQMYSWGKSSGYWPCIVNRDYIYIAQKSCPSGICGRTFNKRQPRIWRFRSVLDAFNTNSQSNFCVGLNRIFRSEQICTK